MKRFLVAAVVTLSLMWTLSTRAGATVTWDFFETGLVYCNNPIIGCSLTPLPIMSITVSTDSGSASWGGPFSSSPPVVTDPNFAFTLGTAGSVGITTIEPPFFTGVYGGYNITWSGEIFVDANITPFLDEDPYVSGLGSGQGGFYQVTGITGCRGALAGGGCTVSGVWLEVPEPSSLLIVAMALLVLLSVGPLRNRRPQPRT